MPTSREIVSKQWEERVKRHRGRNVPGRIKAQQGASVAGAKLWGGGCGAASSVSRRVSETEAKKTLEDVGQK